MWALVLAVPKELICLECACGVTCGHQACKGWLGKVVGEFTVVARSSRRREPPPLKVATPLESQAILG